MNIFKQNINWKTTAYEGFTLNKINKILTLNSRIICRKIFKTIPRVTSIYLIRSFSRGEGSVIINNDKIKILSDLDLLVLSKSPQFLLTLSSRTINNIKTNDFNEFYHIEIMQGHPIAEIEIINEKEIKKIPPSLFIYDLKTAKCIYGSDILKDFPKIGAAEIPLKEGYRLLFDRLYGILLPFSTSFLTSKLSEKKKRHLTFETAKLISACRDAILLLNKVYFPTESQRQEYLRQNWFNKFNFFAQRLPRFLNLSEKTHQYRLKPNKILENDALKLWFDSIHVCSQVLPIYSNRLFNFNINGEIVNFAKFLTKKKLYNFNNKLSFWYSYVKEKTIKSICKTKILAVLLLLLVSVEREKINKKMLEKAINILEIKYPIKNLKDANQLWNILKKIVIENYKPPLPRNISLTTLFNNKIAGIIPI